MIPCCANQENFKYTPKHEFIHHVTGAHHFQSHTFNMQPGCHGHGVSTVVSLHLFLPPFPPCLSKRQHHRNDVALSIHLAALSIQLPSPKKQVAHPLPDATKRTVTLQGLWTFILGSIYGTYVHVSSCPYVWEVIRTNSGGIS